MQDEKEFRDKLSPIYVALNFSLDPKAPADSHGLRPILNYQTANVIEQKVLRCTLHFILLSTAVQTNPGVIHWASSNDIYWSSVSGQ